MNYVLSNWKMYVAGKRGAELLEAIQEGLSERPRRPTVIVCPPFTSLASLRALADPRLVRLGAQNCHWEAEGPYTGEVAPAMLAELVDYVLVGHSERRAAGETDGQIAKKVAAVAEAGLVPILFAGEDEPTGRAAAEAERRLELGLAEVDPARHRVLLVYEPTWAIGAERPAEAGHVRDVVERLKGRLAELGAEPAEVIYGGTVNADNVDELTGIEALDGVGATRGGLEASELLTIVDRVAGAGAR